MDALRKLLEAGRERLRNFPQNFKHNAGKAVDMVLPGNQSNLHRLPPTMPSQWSTPLTQNPMPLGEDRYQRNSYGAGGPSLPVLRWDPFKQPSLPDQPLYHFEGRALPMPGDPAQLIPTELKKLRVPHYLI